MRILAWTALVAIGCTDDGKGDTGACEAHTLAADFGSRLTRVEGCADVVIFAYDDADTIQLQFRVEDVVAAACDAGGELSRTWSLPDPEVVVSVAVGTGLSVTWCTGEWSDGEATATYSATAGTAALDLVGEDCDGDDPEGDATVVLSDVVLSHDDGCGDVTLDEFTFEGLNVGWLPD